MSGVELAVRLAAGLLLIGANAFFVAVEFGLTRLPDLRIDRDEVHSPGLERALSMLDRLEIHLTGCQLGISTTSVLLGVVTEPAVTALIAPVLGVVGITGGSVHGISVVVAVVLLNLVHKVWGEQAPTYLGVERPRDVAERLAPALYWWSTVMHPIIKMGDGLAKWTLRLFGVEITRSWAEAEAGDAERGTRGGGAAPADGAGPVRGRRDLKRRMAALLRSSGEVSSDRQEEVMLALEIDEIPARDVMVPAREMVPLAEDVSSDENRARLARSGYVRYPLLSSDGDREAGGAIPKDRVRGVVYTPGLFDPPERLRGDDLRLGELVEEPVFLPADLPVAVLIDRLQEAGQEVALLLEDDRVVGMVTVTDALEAIAGEVRDPLDEEEEG